MLFSTLVVETGLQSSIPQPDFENPLNPNWNAQENWLISSEMSNPYFLRFFTLGRKVNVSQRRLLLCFRGLFVSSASYFLT